MQHTRPRLYFILWADGTVSPNMSRSACYRLLARTRAFNPAFVGASCILSADAVRWAA
jgi:hypothetical protein